MTTKPRIGMYIKKDSHKQIIHIHQHTWYDIIRDRGAPVVCTMIVTTTVSSCTVLLCCMFWERQVIPVTYACHDLISANNWVWNNVLECLLVFSTPLWWYEDQKWVESYDASVWLTTVPFDDSEYFRESIRHEIRTARERFSGQALSQELGRIQKRLDTVELLSPDIVMNLLLSYRDVQVCVHLPACMLMCACMPCTSECSI